jgi:hypothetical protein
MKFMKDGSMRFMGFMVRFGLDGPRLLGRDDEMIAAVL